MITLLKGVTYRDGNERLEQLATDIRRLEQERDRRAQRAERFRQLLVMLDELPAADEVAFFVQRKSLSERADHLRAQASELDNQRREQEFAFGKAREEHDVLAVNSTAYRRESRLNGLRRVSLPHDCAIGNQTMVEKSVNRIPRAQRGR